MDRSSTFWHAGVAVVLLVPSGARLVVEQALLGAGVGVLRLADVVLEV